MQHSTISQHSTSMSALYLPSYDPICDIFFLPCILVLELLLDIMYGSVVWTFP